MPTSVHVSLIPEGAQPPTAAGYTGWSPDQLDGELEEGAWAVVDMADPVLDAFLSDREDLWRGVLTRQAGTLPWWVNCPRDPSAN